MFLESHTVDLCSRVRWNSREMGVPFILGIYLEPFTILSIHEMELDHCQLGAGATSQRARPRSARVVENDVSSLGMEPFLVFSRLKDSVDGVSIFSKCCIFPKTPISQIGTHDTRERPREIPHSRERHTRSAYL